MDPYALSGMIFTLIVMFFIGGFILTLPLVRRLGGLMEESIRERRDARLERGQLGEIEARVGDLARAIETMHRQLDLTGERQDFLENLLEHRQPEALPSVREATE